MFVLEETNVDYFLTEIRIHLGDYTEPFVYSDALLRTSLLAGIKMLQRRWQNRYIVLASGMVYEILPDGYGYTEDYQYVIPSGYVLAEIPEGKAYIPETLRVNDVFRNTYQIFASSVDYSVSGARVVSQEDEYPIIIATTMMLRKAQITSSAGTFQTWSDGEFSFSNLASAKAQENLLRGDSEELDSFFRKRLASPLRSNFNVKDDFI